MFEVTDWVVRKKLWAHKFRVYARNHEMENSWRDEKAAIESQI